MTVSVAEIWRYPIKGIGAESLKKVALSEGLPLPLDRAWAVLEDGGDASEGWRSCRNFLRGAKGPSLMAVTARTVGNVVTLSHPEKTDISVPLATESGPNLLQWLQDIYPDNRAPAAELVQAPSIGMADASYASVSVMNLASLRTVSRKVGQDLDVRRFRGNIWLEGLAPWEEFDLIGKTLSMGSAQLEVVEPITRCRATEANPKTGQRDIQILQVLQQGWGHTEFGVKAVVKMSGAIAQGNEVTIQ